MKDGFVKIGSATPRIKVGDPAYNAEKIIELLDEGEREGVNLLVFPELSLTGSTCGDLFLHDALTFGAERGLKLLVEKSNSISYPFVVGLPVVAEGKTYNTAVTVFCGHVVGAVAKEEPIGEEDEVFSSALYAPEKITLCGEEVPLMSTVFSATATPNFTFSVVIGSDLERVNTPALELAREGASVIACPRSDITTMGSYGKLKKAVEVYSDLSHSAFAVAQAGEGESVTDGVRAGISFIAVRGETVAESEPYSCGITVAVVDVGAISHLKKKNEIEGVGFFRVGLDIKPRETALDKATFKKFPFVTEADSIGEVVDIQAHALASRLNHIGAKSIVLGVSGGLDSTLALLVCARAVDILGLSRTAIKAISMPGFGTSKKTRSNAEILSERLGTDFKEISIVDAVRVHFKDIGQSEEERDVTYENAQARERTQILMDLANKTGGIVVGTGDLSELALGFATYNGDHMSMYAVNGSVPKTLMRKVILDCAEKEKDEVLKKALVDVVGTPVSPELLPPSGDEIAQITEDIVGPYELHDFFLYHMIKEGASPKKILRMATVAFSGEYGEGTVKKWLKKFLWRFFSQQFKRSCQPDGVQVTGISLSPRGGWRMPSDSSANLWLNEIED